MSFFNLFRRQPEPATVVIQVPARRETFGGEETVAQAWKDDAGKRFADHLTMLAAHAPVIHSAYAMDAGGDEGREFKRAFAWNENGVSEALMMWYASQGFIGHQLCAILAQNWLINKVCSVPAEDAIRHWYDIVFADGKSEKTDVETLQILRKAEKTFQLKKKLTQFIRKGRIFGSMIAIFVVESRAPNYYAYPFNPDAIKPGSYKGIALVEPYWCTPELEASAIAAPDSLNFYEPTWWQINGRRYHRSHLCIFMQDEVADILKPSYKYGGVPVPQKILERVYAAERTANEAPHLALNKRMTVLKVDAGMAKASEEDFLEKVLTWVKFRDNHAVKVIDHDDDIQQHDTALGDFDALMMSQYQLVAAAGNIPATKLIATTPKGFNATGEYEESSYHETLESIQEHNATPFIEKHIQCVMRSEVLPTLGGIEMEVTIAWNPLDSPTAKEYAEIRKIEAETDTLLAEAGVLDAIEIRHKIQADPDSGYSHIDPDKDMGAGEGEGEADLDALNEQLAGMTDELAGGMDADEDKWMTLPNGAHILIGEGGEVKAGAGGALNPEPGVKSLNDVKYVRQNRNKFPLTEGTTITRKAIIAGKGSKTPLKDENRLLKEFDGKEGWSHETGTGHVDFKGESKKAEIHWFSEPSAGVVGVKIKNWDKNES